jgi:predicted DCC family thiol-disulfide oxidoreductase YuxK
LLPGVPAPSVAANLGLRLIQLHLCLIYVTAGLAKLMSPAWWDGSAVAKLLGNVEFQPLDLTWLAGAPGAESAINLATHLTVAFELGYPIFIWRRDWRASVLAIAFAFHLGIGLALGLYEFSLAMIVGNVAFIAGSWLRGLVTGDSQPWARVLYDGACPRCRSSMAVVSAMDPDRLIAPIDLTVVDVSTVHPSLSKDACMRSMHVVRADGRVTAGYDAVMTLARCLPLTWIPSLLSWIPGMAWAGRRLYNHLAATRPREIPCTDDVCGIHGTDSRGGSARPRAESGSTAK